MILPEPIPSFMGEAFHLAYENVATGAGGPFGAVVVRDGKIIGRGVNRVTTANDPTAHAEVNAIRDACRNINDYRLTGAQIYTSCEPCPMCLAALYWSRVDQIFFAHTRSDAAQIGFDDDFLYQEIALPLEKRMLPICAMSVQEPDAFTLWQTMANKVPY